MDKRRKSILAVLAVCFFALTMTSTCYCQPESASAANAQMKHSGMAGHCEHHSGAAKSNRSDCSPRYQSDQFENKTQNFQVSLGADFFSAQKAESYNVFQMESNSFLHFGFEPAHAPPSQFYLLHHAFLI